MLSQSNDGSILALFKKMGWAFYLKCGVVRSYSEFGLFNIEITLTPRGLYNTRAMVETVMQAIELIKTKGVKLHYFDEVSFETTITDGRWLKPATGSRFPCCKTIPWTTRWRLRT
ncbi:metalloprotease [Entomophthora muscae]|uniref:Metalloprotease n=1 Tax=Entomophthora muscae TaxID=34485 RepID=A0ACC2RRD3_9FUNG|nr:metalloprotease [Entomophthora muscae]